MNIPKRKKARSLLNQLYQDKFHLEEEIEELNELLLIRRRELSEAKTSIAKQEDALYDEFTRRSQLAPAPLSAKDRPLHRKNKNVRSAAM